MIAFYHFSYNPSYKSSSTNSVATSKNEDEQELPALSSEQQTSPYKIPEDEFLVYDVNYNSVFAGCDFQSQDPIRSDFEGNHSESDSVLSVPIAQSTPKASQIGKKNNRKK